MIIKKITSPNVAIKYAISTLPDIIAIIKKKMIVLKLPQNYSLKLLYLYKVMLSIKSPLYLKISLYPLM